jgi:hypothetical protein
MKIETNAPTGVGGSVSERALQTLAGEHKARAYLARLQAQQVQPDELAIMVAALYGAALRGFCSAIEKALRGVTR